MKESFSLVGVLAGGASFAILFFVYLGMLRGLEHKAGPTALVLVWLALKIFILIVPGYISGWVSKKSGVLNAAVVSLLIPLIIGLVFTIIGAQHGSRFNLFSAINISWLIPSIIFCTLGGYLWDRTNKRRIA